LPINATCVGTPTWKFFKKIQGFSLAHSFRGKAGSSQFDLGCNVMRVEVVLEDVGARENGAKAQTT